LRRLETEPPGQRGAGRARPVEAILAGAGIGVAGVDQQGTDAIVATQMCLTHHNRRGTETVLGKHAYRFAALGQTHDQDVLAAGFLDTGAGDAQFDAGNRE